MSAKWDTRFLKLAAHIAGWSKDPSTKVGCIVVGADVKFEVQASTGSRAASRMTLNDSKTVNSNIRSSVMQKKMRSCTLHGSVYRFATARRTLHGRRVHAVRSLIRAGIVEVVCQRTEVPERWKKISRCRAA